MAPGVGGRGWEGFGLQHPAYLPNMVMRSLNPYQLTAAEGEPGTVDEAKATL